jgi:four helix bundle protein
MLYVPWIDNMSKGYKNLEVWKKAYKLALKIYDVTKNYPKTEMYGLTTQMRRASTSIIANIAEGYGKNHLGEYIQYVSIAIGSCNELEVFLMFSNDLNYLEKKDFDQLIDIQTRISKMLFNLRKALEIKKSSLNSS